jgi:hypothetical protein
MTLKVMVHLKGGNAIGPPLRVAKHTNGRLWRKAAGHGHTTRLQEFFGRDKCSSSIAKGSNKPFGGLPHGGVIVHDGNQARAPHTDFPLS